ncbi:DNA repair helicase RHP51 [Rhizoctonia solani]|uniref:DNA repair helicase RHP51 n=1 Tax=Rhizoctonia solani TaxID=456999 RepID=A0A8H8NTC3_9AGAM|nr:DNA repair helicase RHP51 [Rhizoctonia solani]QRW19534.1 DNA repair helicase RHP51 [Rhizoctonia solani]
MPTQLNRPIASLQINSAHRSKLMKNGYSTAADIQAVSVEELARDLGISLEDANAISAVAQTQPQISSHINTDSVELPETQRTQLVIAGSQTAAELLKVPASATALSTGNKTIDEILDGGVIKGSLLEISGVPERGTKYLLLRRESDSRGDLPIESLKDVVSSLTVDREKQTTTEVHHARVKSLPELLSCVSKLPQYCVDHPGIKLVIMSQLSYHIQASRISLQAKGKLLTHIKQHLTKTCGTGQVAVVVTTSMAVKLINDEGQPANFSTGTKALLIPTLGWPHELLSNSCNLTSHTRRRVLSGFQDIQTGAR